MLNDLSEFFAHYPENLFHLLRLNENSLDPKLVRELKDYGERQRGILQHTHVFRFDEAAELMMKSVIRQMSGEGLDHLYHKVKLPFPRVLLEAGSPTTEFRVVGLITQCEDRLYTQRFLMKPEGLVPSRFVVETSGLKGELIPTPTKDLFDLASPSPDAERADEEELDGARQLIAIAVALSTLLAHKGMLVSEDVPAFSRPERRRAERKGRPLPALRVSRITLGEFGRGHLEAMQDDPEDAGRAAVRKRTHWVRGHPMRNRSGGISWRMPHLRGAGPLIEQRREVTSATAVEDETRS